MATTTKTEKRRHRHWSDWHEANNAVRPRSWFVVRYTEGPHRGAQYLLGARGNIRRFGTPEAARRAADKARAETVDVIFRKWPKTEGGDVIALFPGLAGNAQPHTCSSYQHVGQHGTADLGALTHTLAKATPEEYADLKRELESPPYRYILRVVQRVTRKHDDARREQVGAIAGRFVRR